MEPENTEPDNIHTAIMRAITQMNHDLRTPVNAIMGYSMMIGRLSDECDKVNYYAKQIFVSGQILLELINETLDMSSIETGRAKLLEREFSLTTAVAEVQTAINPLAESKKQNFSCSINNQAGTDRIIGDKQKLCQILSNILSNAVKYTPECGSVDMCVELEEAGKRNVTLVCRIKDSGCGMSGDFMKVMFEPFEREDNSLKTSVQGTGLGMCIIRSFTELMNGELSVESEQGKGTVVTVRIPVKTAADQKIDSGNDTDWSDVLQGMRFLAAEDNVSNAEILSELLRMMGAECTIAVHGRDALDIFKNSEAGRFDMILMDAQMPVMDGYRAAAAIRNSTHPDAKTIKIIAMTADVFEEDIQRAMMSGMDAHVPKPLDIRSLVETIKMLEHN